MTNNPNIQYSTPFVTFDDALERQLPLVQMPSACATEPVLRQSASPFNGYHRSLTEEGGFLIRYQDAARGPLITTLRIFCWVFLTIVSLDCIDDYGPSNIFLNLLISLLTPFLLNGYRGALWDALHRIYDG